MRHAKTRAALLSIGLVACLGASQASPPMPASELRDWDEVESIRRDTPAAATYQSMMGAWLLAPDGRYAMVPHHDDDEGPPSAILGRHRVDGGWIEVELQGHAIDLDRLDASQRAEYEAWREEIAIEEAVEAEASVADDAEQDGTDVAEAADAMDEWLRRRLLRVPYAGGELLVRESFVLMAANGWDGSAPLELIAEAWRLPENVAPGEFEHRFLIEDPLRAGLPVELTRLLRRDSIEARVLEVKESTQTLEWRAHEAKLHLGLDRGERAGLYRGMTMRGLPPDEDVSGEIVEVTLDDATLRVSVDRFSPRETPTLPTPGVRLTTRWDRDACPIDTSAAVRAKVTAVATPPELVAWDEDGFAFFELDLDQGAAQGLMAGDRLAAEDRDVDGEGRVLEAASGKANVLWRVRRYHESMPVRLPAAGDVLVTPAWQRAQWDVFGGTRD
jgi:hypothetical protein